MSGNFGQDKRGVSMNTTQILTATSDGIATAASILQAGGLVAFPTETVYGLGADARNDIAVAQIFEAKRRPHFNPLIIHLPNLAAVQKIAVIPPAALILAQTFWPGPLTLVLPRRANSGLSDLVTAGLDTVAIRIPEHPLAQQLLTMFDGPVAAPSANPSGKVSPTTAAHVFAGLNTRIDAILDGGPCDVGLESTIIGFENTAPVLLRAGGLPAEGISQALGVNLQARQTGNITAPGQLKSHYAPGASLRLNAISPTKTEAWLGFGPSQGTAPTLNLSPSANLREAAANLFAYMRELDEIATQNGLTEIAVAPIPMHGLGVAINDRLERAAAPRS